MTHQEYITSRDLSIAPPDCAAVRARAVALHESARRLIVIRPQDQPRAGVAQTGGDGIPRK